MALSETAYAKINLALHVRRKRADGYHDLETLFAFAEEGDRLWVEEGEGLSLNVAGPFASLLIDTPSDNLIILAAHAFAEAFGVAGGMAIHLEKSLPVAAGIGGGSADAAAMLRLLCRRHGVSSDDKRVIEIARGLGADVPACLGSVAVRGEGRGDDLEPVTVPPLPLLLVNPGEPLATGPVFAGWDGVDRGALAAGDTLAAALAGRNDLEAPARALLPVIGDVITMLMGQDSVLLARMSGSGATCFALFASDAARDAAGAAIAAERPGWWSLATRLR